MKVACSVQQGVDVGHGVQGCRGAVQCSEWASMCVSGSECTIVVHYLQTSLEAMAEQAEQLRDRDRA